MRRINYIEGLLARRKNFRRGFARIRAERAEPGGVRAFPRGFGRNRGGRSSAEPIAHRGGTKHSNHDPMTMTQRRRPNYRGRLIPSYLYSLSNISSSYPYNVSDVISNGLDTLTNIKLELSKQASIAVYSS